jgi:glycerol kinase
VAVVLAIDAGTTGVRTVAVDETGRPGPYAYREFPQHFPRPGWVEHDPEEIWAATAATLEEVVGAVSHRGGVVAAVGITNQRETTVAWDRRTGRPRHRAVVWQDRRTAGRCEELRAAGAEPAIRARTGLVLDPYFSATKMEWLLGDGGVAADADLALGTVDSWLIWRLSGGRAHVTDPSNASRTMLYDLRTGGWSDELCSRFGIPRRALAEIVPSSGALARTDPATAAGLEVPVAGILGDQQAALLGQACLRPGMAKNTYGTGSFVLVNLGTGAPVVTEGLLTTVAWDLGEGPAFAMEGSIFVTGAAVQWLRDGLGIITEAAETAPLAEQVPDSAGVVVVPAFAGLGAPYWDPWARGGIFGLTRGTGRAHLARAVIEAMAHQTADVVEAIAAAGTPLAELRVDGGASVMDLLCRTQADLLGVTVRRPAVRETTALGAAFAAGLGSGVWSSPAEVEAAWREEAAFPPDAEAGSVAAARARWRRAVERVRGWAADDAGPAGSAPTPM